MWGSAPSSIHVIKNKRTPYIDTEGYARRYKHAEYHESGYHPYHTCKLFSEQVSTVEDVGKCYKHGY
jgi:hypothetical protein